MEFRRVLFRSAERERTLMGQISLRVGERSHMMSCRDGEEEHLLRLAAMIDRKCNEATTALGVMPEPRLLLTAALLIADELARSEEHTSELQSLMRISYAVFCLKKKTKYTNK